MKHLNTFKVYEELQKSTYTNAAEMLAKKGHSKRADNLKKHADSVEIKDAEFTYYSAPHNTKVTNPVCFENTISEMKVNKNDVSKKGDKEKTFEYVLVVSFKKPADTFKIDLSNTGEKLSKNSVKFQTRKDAKRFVDMCNKFAADELKDVKFTKLSVNDFYAQ